MLSRRMMYNGAGDCEPGSKRRAPKTSILDLPLQLLIDIFSRVPIKAVLYSRCVCKSWSHLLSDIEFFNIYPSQVPITLLLQATNFRGVLDPNPNSKVLFLLDIQCKNAYCGLPLNTKTSLPDNGYTYTGLILKPKVNLPDIDFGLVNSCNGLLCLYDFKTNDPIYVCNPILGQCITLPRAKSATCTGSVTCHGFGFSQMSKKYKVMRTVQRVSFKKLKHTVEIYTLGDGAWRSIGDHMHFPSRSNFNVFVNGILHWDSYYGDCYCSFNFDSEQFGVILGPGNKNLTSKYRCLGVLKERLSVCSYNNAPQVEIWLMNEYGVRESWTKEFVISFEVSVVGIKKPISCEPIKILDNGDILMLLDKCALVLYDAKQKRARSGYCFLADKTFEAIAHTPTFLSLTEVAKGENLIHI